MALEQPTPPRLSTGEVLVGEGDRHMDVGPISVNTYHLALYVNCVGAAAALSAYAGREASELATDAGFLDDLIMARFNKILRMTLYRVSWRDRMIKYLRQPLQSREGTAAHVEEFLAAFPQALEGDNIDYVFNGDGETLEMRHRGHCVYARRDQCMWVALQGVWLDDESIVPELRASLLEHLQIHVLQQCDCDAFEPLPNAGEADAARDLLFKKDRRRSAPALCMAEHVQQPPKHGGLPQGLEAVSAVRAEEVRQIQREAFKAGLVLGILGALLALLFAAMLGALTQAALTAAAVVFVMLPRAVKAARKVFAAQPG
eukprot:NODE_12363_length_1229_cov_3.259528.p1 GENE.NODE_12363_length_1229_cov_3.259528~~NODE_12363_length_1229_cov_3.259528.p1  ORF type:complete len:347 (-),score=82.93 NODE_12363_length_1229_cov_3.259528:187-1134(-)